MGIGRILFCGDIMPGGVLEFQKDYLDKEIQEYLRGFDLRIGTLECGVGNGIPFDEAKMAQTKAIVYSRNEDLLRLKEMEINVVSLANNHAFDLGLAGMENAIARLDDLGILHCGAGHDINEARKPAVVEVGGKTVAILGCMVDCRRPVIFHKATETSYGVYQLPIGELSKDIAAAKKQYDYVVVMPHWGEEHSYYPPSYCKDCGKKMIDAGADLVIGSHPHILNPKIRYKGKDIYFSLGNFLFPDKCMQVPRPMYYPETKDEYLSLKRVWTYPKSISEPVVAVWKSPNRIGMMVDAHLEDNISTSHKYHCMTQDNTLHMYRSLSVRFRMAFLALLIKLPGYRYVRRVCAHRYNFIAKAINRLPAFNIPVEL